VSSNHHATSVTTYNPDGSVESTANTGLFFNVVVPGLGAIYQGLGRRVLDGDGTLIFLAGPADARNANFGAICAYLTGP
jgi:hypothetical protein